MTDTVRVPRKVLESALALLDLVATDHPDIRTSCGQMEALGAARLIEAALDRADDTVTLNRMREAIAQRAVERGRPLTAQEQLDNLAAALAEDADTPCPLCGARDDEPCGYAADGEACKLEMGS